MAPQVYARMIQTLGAEAPETDVFASRDTPLLRKCRRHWHRGDSGWHRHWGLKEWGPMDWHGSLEIPDVRWRRSSRIGRRGSWS